MKTRLQTILFIFITTLIVSVLLFTELVKSATAGDQPPEPDTPARIEQFAPQNTTGDDITIIIDGGELVNAVNTDPSTGFVVGEPVTLTAVADDAWEFVNWSGSLTGGLSPQTLLFTGDDSVTAHFEIRCFALKLTISGEGGPIAASPEKSTECPSTGQYVAGEVIGLTANPADHWYVSSWTGDHLSAIGDTTATETMPASNDDVSVTYTPKCFSLGTSVSPDPSHGSIERLPEPDQYCIDQYLEGTEVSLTANPAPGYAFTNWNGDITGSTNPETLVMSEDRSVTASFEKGCHPLTLTHAPAGSGSNPEAEPGKSDQCQSDEYVLGEVINLSAIPNPGFQVESWLGTNNNSSISNSNTLTFPALSGAEGHIVTVNYIRRPTLQFSKETYTVNEDVLEASVSVKRTGSLAETVSVKYATSNGSAKSGQDYTAANGTLTFGPDVSTRSFIVPIKNDNVKEGTENLFLTLSNPNGAVLGAANEAELVILDDEGDPTVQFSTTTYEAVESSSSVAITVTLFPASTDNIFVEFNTLAGTAVDGEDYWDRSQTIRFWPGMASEQVIVTLLDDMLDEPDETVTLQLSDIIGADLGESEAILTLIDDDDPPSVQFSESQYYAKEGEPTAPITFTLSAASALSVTLEYEVIELTVGRLFADTVTFDPGEESKTVELPIGSYQVGDELNIVLNTADNATLAPPSSAILTILDINRSDCHLLTLQNTGYGSPPLTTNIDRSIGCPTGQFVADELIDVLGQPDLGWVITGWHGTLNDSGATDENVVRMPDSNHTVTIYYLTSAFLPTIMQDYVSYFEGPQEVEPNNALGVSQANGPLRSGAAYFGSFPTVSDQFDIYYFYLDEKDNVQVTVKDIPAGRDYNLYLYNGNGDLRGFSGALYNGDEHITSSNLDPGIYYVTIHYASGPPSSSQYKVTATFE